MRALRGHRSQVQFSRRLGFTSNVAAEWEAGRRFPTAPGMLHAAERVGIQLDEVFERFEARSAARFQGRETLWAWLEAFRGGRSIGEIAATCGRTRHQVGRWLAGKTTIRLPDFLALVHGLTGRLHVLVSLLVDIEQIPSLKPAFQRRSKIKQVASEHPWAVGVLTLLSTRQYASQATHDDKWLAGRLGVDRESLTQCLDALCRADLVRIEQASGKYVPAELASVDLKTAPPERRRHWAEVAHSRLRDDEQAGRLEVQLFAVSAVDQQRIEALTNDYLRDLAAICTNTSARESMGMVAVHAVRFAEPT